MHHRDMRKIFPADSGEVLLNPGMGYLFLQRGHRKVRFDELAPGEWFLSRPLSDKIIFDVAWSVVEPGRGPLRLGESGVGGLHAELDRRRIQGRAADSRHGRKRHSPQ